MGFKRSKLRLRQRPRLSLPEASPHRGCELLTGRESPIVLIAMLRRGAFTSRLVMAVAKSRVILLSYENPSFGGNRRVRILSPSGKPSRTRYDY